MRLNVSSMADGAVNRLSDRLTDFRDELEATFKAGARTMRNGLIEGHLIGNIVGGLVGGLIQDAIHQRTTSPRWIIARRIYDAVHLINDAYTAGERHDYAATQRLLRIHEFKAEQARYVVDLLLQAGAVKEYEEEEGETFLMLDPENEVLQTLLEGYSKNTLTYITVSASPMAEDDDDVDD